MLDLIPALESLVFTFLPDKDSLMNPITYNGDPTRCQLLQLNVLEGLACNQTRFLRYSLYTLTHGSRFAMSCMLQPLSSR